MEKVVIYTDGGCRGNQSEENNVGGYGIVIMYKDLNKELYGGTVNTTNNKMELMACIKALEFLKEIKNIPIELYSDSAYLCNAINQKWIEGWIRKGWVNSSKEPVKNRDLWERINDLTNGRQIKFFKVKGHADNPWNNRADELANIAMNEIELNKIKVEV